MRNRRFYVRKGWLFWQATNPDEPVGLFGLPTVRARSRERVIEKAQKRFWPKRTPWEWEIVELEEADR